MPNDYGVTPTGFKKRRIADIRDSMRARMSELLGAPVDVRSSSVIGIVIGVIATLIGEVWSGLQGLWDAGNPTSNTGAALENDAARAGVFRRSAAPAETRTLVVAGTPGAVIAPGLVARGTFQGGDYSFALVEPLTIGSGGEGTGARWVALEARAVALPPGVVTEITTGAAGAMSVSQPGAIIGGRDVEKDPSLRARRDLAFATVGAGNDFAVASRVAALPFVGQSVLASNRSRHTDARGLPGNSFAVIVWPSSGTPPLTSDDEEELAKTIAERQTQGVEPVGDLLFFVTDSEGTEQPVRFSYATPVAISVTADLVVGEGYAGDSEAVAAIVATFARVAGIGGTVYASAFTCPLLDVGGVRAAFVTLDVGAGAVDEVAIGYNEIGTVDASNVAIITRTP